MSCALHNDLRGRSSHCYPWNFVGAQRGEQDAQKSLRWTDPRWHSCFWGLQENSRGEFSGVKPPHRRRSPPHPQGGSWDYPILCSPSASLGPCAPPAQLSPGHFGSWPLRDAWAVPSRVQGRGLWTGTKFKPALPDMTLSGRPRLASCQPSRARPKEDASGKIPCTREPSFRKVCPRGVDGRGLFFWPAALSREGRKISVLAFILKHEPQPQTWTSFNLATNPYYTLCQRKAPVQSFSCTY